MVIGYIDHVSDESRSRSDNTYDIKVKTTPTEFVTVRVMKKTNITISKKIFQSKIGKGVVLSNLSSSESEVLFFNKLFGSNISDAVALNFKYTNIIPMDLSELKTKSTGRYDFTACITWNASETTTNVKVSGS